MSKARSYKTEPFISFEKQSYSVMKDDFVHEKLLTVKTNIQSTNGGVNLKESLSTKGEALTSTGESKLWFYLKNNGSLYTKVLPNAITLAYDHGIQVINGRSFNWFGGVDTNRALSANVWKIGVEVFDAAGKWSLSNALQLSQNDRQLTWLNKLWVSQNEWFFNKTHTIDLSGKAVKNAGFLVAYRRKGEESNDFTVRSELSGYSNVEELKKSLWEGNKVTLNWVHAHKGKCAHGLEFSSHLSKITLNPSDIWRKLSTAYEVQLPEQNSTLKLRLGGNWSAAVALKHKIGSYGSYIWGAEVSEIGSKNNVRFGVQVDLNL